MCIRDSLYSLYGRFGITTDNDSLFDAVTHEYKKMPLLGDLYEEMAGVEELHRVRNILSPLINGSLAAYNRPTNIDPVSYTHLDVYKRQHRTTAIISTGHSA